MASQYDLNGPRYTFEQMAKNPLWLKSVQELARLHIDQGTDPDSVAYITHLNPKDPNFLTLAELLIPRSLAELGQNHHREVLNPGKITFQQIIDFDGKKRLLSMGKLNKQTQDQIAAVMLLHGGENQQAEAIKYFQDNGKPSGWSHVLSSGPDPDDMVQIRAIDHLVLLKSSPNDLRKRGLMILSCNDYFGNGPRVTWQMLESSSGMIFRGDGRTDAEALDSIRFQLDRKEK